MVLSAWIYISMIEQMFAHKVCMLAAQGVRDSWKSWKSPGI